MCKKISQEKITNNFLRFVKKMEEYGCYSEEMMNDIGEEIKNASYGMSEDCGAAYQGSLIDVVLYKLCKTAFKINDCVFSDKPLLKVNEKMLIRVLLLQHLSKALMFTPTRDAWKEKKGILYDFNQTNTNLKAGERSVFLCQKYGIKLSEEEFEAMRIIDTVENVEGKLLFSTTLTNLVYMSNNLTNLELKREYISNKKTETIEK